MIHYLDMRCPPGLSSSIDWRWASDSNRHATRAGRTSARPAMDMLYQKQGSLQSEQWAGCSVRYSYHLGKLRSGLEKLGSQFRVLRWHRAYVPTRAADHRH